MLNRRKQLEEVHRECEYEAERAEKLRRKVTNRLMGGILAPEIPLYGFNMTEAQRRSPNTRMVKSLRTQVRVIEAKERNKKEERERERDRDRQTDTQRVKKRKEERERERKEERQNVPCSQRFYLLIRSVLPYPIP